MFDRRHPLDWERRGKFDWARPPVSTGEIRADEVESELLLGMPGSGKSNALRLKTIAAAKANDCCIVAFDPHGNAVDDIKLDLAERGFEGRIEELNLANPDSVLSIDLFPRPTALTVGLRRLEENRAIDDLLYLFGQHRKDFNPSATPNITTWSKNALLLISRQHEEVSLRLARWGLCPGSELQMQLFRGCTDETLVREFLRVNALRPLRDQENLIGPARKFL